MSGFQRSKLINKLADLIERDAEDLAALETLNNGKPFKIARYVCDAMTYHCLSGGVSSKYGDLTHWPRDFDVGDSVGCLRYYAGWADKIVGQVRIRVSVVAPNDVIFRPWSYVLLIFVDKEHRDRAQDQVCIHEARADRGLWPNVRRPLD